MKGGEVVLPKYVHFHLTRSNLYFADKPVFVFIKFHESDLLSMAPLIKFVCES